METVTERQDRTTARRPKWSRFDGIFALCHASYRGRRETLVNELNRVGITEFETIWQFRTPLIRRMIETLGYERPSAPSFFSKTLAHYQALKIAYDRGLEHVLIFEDTARMLNDIDLMTSVVNELPTDYDCAKFEWIPNRYGDNMDPYVKAAAERRESGMFNTDHWICGNGLPTSGNAMIAYSRNGMRRKIELMERYAEDRHLITDDDYDILREFGEDLICYLSLPIAAIQDTASFSWPYGDKMTHLGSTSSYAVQGDHVNGEDYATPFDRQVGELVKAVSVDRKIRVAVVGDVSDASADVFSRHPSVESVFELRDKIETAETSSDARTALPIEPVLARKGVPAVDLVYVEASASADERLLSHLRSVFPPTVSFAGPGYAAVDSAVRRSVDAVFGLPDQDLSLNIWVVFGNGENKNTRYWRFLTGRFGNQLYYLLQAHRLGTGNKYAVPSDDTYYQFMRFGAGNLIGTVDDREKTCTFSWGQQWDIGTHYTEEDVRRFVEDTVLRSRLYTDIVAQHGLDETTVALHIRCTDWLTDQQWQAFDREKYLTDALDTYMSFDGNASSVHAARVFSDDKEMARKLYDGQLSRVFSSVEYVTPGYDVDDLVWMATHRDKILFNSTYSTWAGHIGDAIFGKRHRVIVPSAFYRSTGDDPKYIGGMSILAAKAWKMLPVRLYDGTMYPEQQEQSANG